MSESVGRRLTLVAKIPPESVRGPAEHDSRKKGWLSRGQSLHDEVLGARAFLAKNAVDDPGKSPFRDRGGHVERMAAKITTEDSFKPRIAATMMLMNVYPEEASDAMHGVEADKEPLGWAFMYSRNVVPGPKVYAGSILADTDSRFSGIRMPDGSETICVMDRIEAYIAAVAVLRKIKLEKLDEKTGQVHRYDAGLAYAVVSGGPGGHDSYSPVIALTSESNASLPLITFSLECSPPYQEEMGERIGIHEAIQNAMQNPDMDAGMAQIDALMERRMAIILNRVNNTTSMHPPMTELEPVSDYGVQAITVALWGMAIGRRIVRETAEWAERKQGVAHQPDSPAMMEMADKLAMANAMWGGMTCPVALDAVGDFYLNMRDAMMQIAKNPNGPIEENAITAGLKAGMHMGMSLASKLAQKGQKALAEECVQLMEFLHTMPPPVWPAP